MWEERDLYGSVAMSKGMFEFFLNVFRRLSEKLKLPVLVGTHAVGELVGAAENVGELAEALRSYPTWVRMAADLSSIKEMLLPVPIAAGERSRALRECVLARVTSVRAGEALGEAAELRVRVQDRLVPAGGTSARGTALAQNIDGLVRGARRHAGADSVSLEQAEFPACESPTDGTVCVLGLLVARLCEHVGLPCANVAAGGFAAQARAGLRLGFGMLRAGAYSN